LANCGTRIKSEDYADFIIDYTTLTEEIITRYDICYNIIFSNYAVAYASIATLPDNLIQTFNYSILPHCYGLLNIDSIRESGIQSVRNIPALNLRGQGVLIGIVDTGIDYTHEAFINADGTSRIASIWDQTIDNESTPLEDFYYGTEYTQEQINNALLNPEPLSIVPSMDENGHGTFIAGIAAGNQSIINNFSGVAPNAELLIVKLKPAKQFNKEYFKIPEDSICYQENDIILGVKYLYNMARKLSRPISICIGLGTSQGGHDSRDFLSTYLNYIAVQHGIGISVAAGNEGNTAHHYSGIIDNTTGYDTVELRVGADNTGFSMELWGKTPNFFSIDILSPTGEYIPPIPARIGESRKISFIFEDTVIFLDFELIEVLTGDQLILLRFQSPTEGIWRFRVYSRSDLKRTFNIWLPIRNFLDDDTYFLTPEPNYTLTSPGNATFPIVVTAYNSITRSLYLSASRGYTRTNIINPSFAAPGVNMIGPYLNNDYIEKSGTSIAAAFTSGVLAMLLEWSLKQSNRPMISTIEMYSILLLGADRDPNITYPNKEWGYGTLNVYNAFNTLRGL
jgi:subtilisin family serine protease